MWFELGEAVEIVFPAGADGIGDKPGKVRIGQSEPTARRDAVGHVDDPAGMQLVQFRKELRFHQLRMQRRDTIDLVRHDEGEFAHMHFVVAHDGNAGGAGRIGHGVGGVDHLDDLHVARQHRAHEPCRPPLQSLGQQRVVGVAQALLGNVHRLGKRHPIPVDEKADQFGRGDRRMGIVHLDRHVLVELGQIVVNFHVAAQDVLYRRRGHEVFLLQPQLLALKRGVVGVEHARDGARERFGCGGGGVIAPVEAFEVEQRGGLGAPEPQGVGPAPFPADDGHVVGRCQHGFARLPDHLAVALGHVALEPDRVAGFGPLEFERVALGEPVFRGLDLVAVLEALAEQPVFVAQAVAVAGAAKRGHALHVAGRQPAEAAIAKRGVGLVMHQHVKILAQIGHCGGGDVLEPEVDRGIFEDAADQVFHRQVEHALVVVVPGVLGRGKPRFHDPVAQRERKGQPPIVGRCVALVFSHRIFEVVENIATETFPCQVHR